MRRRRRARRQSRRLRVLIIELRGGRLFELGRERFVGKRGLFELRRRYVFRIRLKRRSFELRRRFIELGRHGAAVVLDMRRCRVQRSSGRRDLPERSACVRLRHGLVLRSLQCGLCGSVEHVPVRSDGRRRGALPAGRVDLLSSG